jgi:2-(1,2-epoxy-1,2-dihydrophenyl)acetyl-CoA isomerase
MSDYEDLIYEVKDGVAIITLNRPERLNALSDPMVDGLARAVSAASEDDQVRAVIVTGAGRGFCSGRDVSRAQDTKERESQQKPSVADARYNLRRIHRIAAAVERLDKPYIAAVNGPAAGAGMDLASMADIRFAGRDARFTQAYTRNAIVPGNGGCYFLPRIVGMARALELLWTSRKFDAEEALAMGYVSRVIETDKLLEETLAFARELAEGPPVAIQFIKQLCYQSQGLDLATSLRVAQYMQTIAMNTEDAREGLASLREKRPARFTGK